MSPMVSKTHEKLEGNSRSPAIDHKKKLLSKFKLNKIIIDGCNNEDNSTATSNNVKSEANVNSLTANTSYTSTNENGHMYQPSNEGSFSTILPISI